MLSFKAVAFLLGQTVAGIQTQHDSKGKVHILGGDIINRCEKKKSSFEYVCHSEWSPRQSCLNLQT
jgi:hypothetical protein